VGRTTILHVVERRAREAEKYVQECLNQAQAEYDKPLATRPGIDAQLIEMDGCESIGKVNTTRKTGGMMEGP